MADTLFRPLFSCGKAEDPAYLNLRNIATPEARAGKEFAERLWAQYHPFADTHFLTEIRRDFHARFWEMYLTCALLQHGQQHSYSVCCPKPKKTGGPDILVEHGNHRIWIEAVVATDGDATKADSVTKPELAQGYTVPDEKMVLRYTTAIYEKHKKYLEYRSKGIVAADDSYVIAVNGSPLSYRWAQPEIPRILEAVFPIGPIEVTLDRKTAKIVEVGHQFRPIVYKNTGGEVSTEFFVNNQYCGISAILHSYANAYMTVLPFAEGLVDQQNADQLGIDFLVVHNPTALRPVPHALIAATREYWATPVDGGYMELSVTPSPNSNTAVRTIADMLEEISARRRYQGFP